MQVSMIAAVFRKEGTDLIRDRRTLISMVAIPILVMPVLMIIITRVMANVQEQAEQEAKSMAVAIRVTTPAARQAVEATGYRVVEKPDLRAAVQNKEVSAAVEETGFRQTRIFNVYADESNQTSSFAAVRIREALGRFKEFQVRALLRQSGVPESVLNPFVVNGINIAPERKMAGMVWGSILGYVLLLMMFTGGLYPAIDMTAGEKERKTLEPFLATPAGRAEIVAGKIIAAIAVIFVTAVLTLASLMFSLKAFGSGDMAKTLSVVPLDAQGLGLILLTVLPLAIFAASIMIAIALFARSYKEGQSYLTPLTMIVILPAFLGGIPGLKMTLALYLIPIFNASQVIRSVLMGEVTAGPFLLTFAANLVYAAIAAHIARSRFENESVLFRT